MELKDLWLEQSPDHNKIAELQKEIQTLRDKMFGKIANLSSVNPEYPDGPTAGNLRSLQSKARLWFRQAGMSRVYERYGREDF
ncbi:MAG: hypothetical protein MZV70_55115 [Desulfobacterales bacterium]|nr:hypothetical protein [Desulfobacterales bacterium]